MSLGTPEYMSPEQASGERALGPKSDIYSLACLLYEMLGGDTSHAGSPAQAIMVRVLTESPTQPVCCARRSRPTSRPRSTRR